jgi:hypothetical protein
MKKEKSMSVLEIVAVIAIVAYVIGRQLIGEPLRGRRLMVLPAILVVVGATSLVGHGQHLVTSDIVIITIGGVVAAAIGAVQGSRMRLEARNGTLWGQMPVSSLWLWLALVISRVIMIVVASNIGAHIAAGAAPILLTLGINRLAQAAVVAPRALGAGIAFSPEKNGSTFLGGLFGTTHEDSAGVVNDATPYDAASPMATWQTGLRVLGERIANRVS